MQKALESGLITERQIGPVPKIKLVSFENAVEFINQVPPLGQKQTKLKFIEMIRRYLGGDNSLLKFNDYFNLNESQEPDKNVDLKAEKNHGISKRKYDEMKVADAQATQLEAKNLAREADLEFITKAACGLKEICGGQLDDESKEALKAKMFKLLERD
jgi:hypothetical protein